jgi:hypothetical protein
MNRPARRTMPCHTHERRMEAYVYFDYATEDTRVFHMMGKPDETKHLVVDITTHRPDKRIITCADTRMNRPARRDHRLFIVYN